MTTVDDLLTPKPTLIVNGRYRIGGRSYTRTTNFVKTIEDRFTLERYQKRMVLLGLAARPELYAQLSTLGLDDRDQLNDLADAAITASGADERAAIGTELHRLAELVDRGETPDLGVHAADIAAYRKALDVNGVTIIEDWMERVIVNHTWDVAGRFDRLVRLSGHALPMVADIKTGSIEHGLHAIAAQLAVYAGADQMFNEDTGRCEPMTPVDQSVALIIHLPQGEARCDLVFVPLDVGRRTAQLCQDVRELRRTKVEIEMFKLAVDERADYLRQRVVRIVEQYPEAIATLQSNWPLYVPTFGAVRLGAPAHDATQLEMIALAISATESKHDVPFADDVDPANERPPAEVIEHIVKRMQALPDDLRFEQVETSQPTPGSRRFQNRHVAAVLERLDVLEAKHLQRIQDAERLLRALWAPDDEAGQRAIREACGVDGDRWTETQLRTLVAIRGVCVTKHLVIVDGALLVADADAFIELFGSKTACLAACKPIADALGLPRPRSAIDAASTPAVVAVAARAMNEATDQTKEQSP